MATFFQCTNIVSSTICMNRITNDVYNHLGLHEINDAKKNLKYFIAKYIRRY